MISSLQVETATFLVLTPTVHSKCDRDKKSGRIEQAFFQCSDVQFWFDWFCVFFRMYMCDVEDTMRIIPFVWRAYPRDIWLYNISLYFTCWYMILCLYIPQMYMNKGLYI